MNAEREALCRPFLDGERRVTQFPVRERKRLAVLVYLAEKFEPGTDYREREVNAILDEWHTFGDFYLLRRALVDAGYLNRERDGSRYWRPAQAAPCAEE